MTMHDDDIVISQISVAKALHSSIQKDKKPPTSADQSRKKLLASKSVSKTVTTSMAVKSNTEVQKNRRLILLSSIRQQRAGKMNHMTESAGALNKNNIDKHSVHR